MPMLLGAAFDYGALDVLDGEQHPASAQSHAILLSPAHSYSRSLRRRISICRAALFIPPEPCAMSDTEDEGGKGKVVRMPARVGYKHPPVHTRFQPGQSGNPSGRAKGSQNFKTLFNKILNEKIAVREGAGVRKVSKAEAILRTVVVGALKGDVRHAGMLMKLAEQAGGFDGERTDISEIRRVIVSWKGSEDKENDAV